VPQLTNLSPRPKTVPTGPGSGESMKTTRTRRVRRAALFAVSAVGVAATVITAGTGSAVASPASGGTNPVVRVDGGLIRGVNAAGEVAVAATAASVVLVRSAGRHALRGGLPAGTDRQPIPPARDDQRRLPEPE